MFRRSCCAMLACLGFATALPAQAMPIDVEGTIIGMEGNVIAIQDGTGAIFQAELTNSWRGADGVNYRVQTPVTIIVSGTEDPYNLRPGQVIQFQATLSNRRAVVGEVKKATLITPLATDRVGIIAAEEIDDGEENGKKKTGNLEDCLIVAQITRANKGSLTVTWPGMRAMNFKFADDAELQVSGNNLSLARVGDKIHAAGSAVRLPLFAAWDVKIEHSPLVDEKARPRVAGNPVAGAGKPMAGDGAGNPFALGDPDEKNNDPNAPAKPRVKLELIKVN